jgi:hypothetical protein
MKDSCRQCKHFNQWAVAMHAIDATPICRKEVWQYDPMAERGIENDLARAMACDKFEFRNSSRRYSDNDSTPPL